MGAAVLARFGEVDVLVNAAGINVPRRSFEALSLDDWHAVLATNLHGAYYCVRAFLPGCANAHGDHRQYQLRCRKSRAGPRGTGVRLIEVRPDGPDAADQRGGTRETGCGRARSARATSIRRSSTSAPNRRRRRLRARMLQPDDLAECVWLVATLPRVRSSTRSPLSSR